MCGCGFFEWILLTFVIAGLFIFISPKQTAPVKYAGIYTQPGRYYWLKVAGFYLLMKIRKWKDARDKNKEKDHTKMESYNSGYGTKSKNSPEEMDKVQPLSDHPLAIDAVYMNGANRDGFCIVAASARRPQGVVNGFFIFTIPEVGTLTTPRLPDSLLFGGSDEYFGAEGLRFEPIVPMKHWKLSYKGELKLKEDPSKRFQVEFEADWKSTLDYFDYDTMIPPWTMARAIAKEPWSREYFQMLKEAHQTHYEQHGDLTGTIKFEGKSYSFVIPSMRDHSYGFKRDWKLLHRYMMHAFRTEDGRRFDTINVCQPQTSSDLELGYIYEMDGSLHPVERLDLPLWTHGENGTLPTDYGFTFKANGKVHYVQVEVLDTLHFHIGWEWEAKIVERFCKFTVDGVTGYGVSECHFRHTGGRPESFTISDPDWTREGKVN